MAACCTYVGVVGGAHGCSHAFAVSTVPAICRPQFSPAGTDARCFARLPPCCKSSGSIVQHLASMKDTRTPPRRPSQCQKKFPMQLQTLSSSFCSRKAIARPSNVVFTEQNTSESAGSGSGMSIEERDAILAFNEASAIQSASDEEEEGNSSESLQSSSEENLTATQTKLQERSEVDEPSAKAATGQGATIVGIIMMYLNLLHRPVNIGNGKMVAGAGSAVLERVEEEVERLRALETVNGQYLFEILRVVKLLQMDIQLIAATRKDSILAERIDQTKAHCVHILNILRVL